METSSPEENGARKMMDTLVAGYLGRQKYWESLKCFMNESPILRAAQCGGMSIILGDTIHGKHLEEIAIQFSEYGSFGLTPALLDFGLRLRSLANEFTSLTNAGTHWSDAQKILYGKHAPPSRSCSQQRMQAASNSPDDGATNQNVLTASNADSTMSVCSQHSNGSTSTRRKCNQPVSINTRRREFVKEVVEPAVHSAQQIIDNGNGNVSDPSSSLSAVSMITIDESAVGTLDRCMAHENFAELIESIEKDFPDGFFDSFPHSENAETLQEPVMDVTSSQISEAQQGHEQSDESSQNLYDIPRASDADEPKPLCFSTPKTKAHEQERKGEKPSAVSTPSETSSSKSSAAKPQPRRTSKVPRKKPVVAESAIFRERVEVDCPYLPSGETEKSGAAAADAGRNSSVVSETRSSTDGGKTKTGKLEISAGWRKLVELCDESNNKSAETVQDNGNPETCLPGNQTPKDSESVKDPSSSAGIPETKREIRSEFCTSSAVKSGDRTTGSTDFNNRHLDKCSQDKEAEDGAKSTSLPSIEMEINSLFEVSDDNDSENSQNLKGSEWGNSSDLPSFRAVPVMENGKDSEDRELRLGPDISGDEHPVVEKRSLTDKKKKRQQKRRTSAGDLAGDSKSSPSKKKQLEGSAGGQLEKRQYISSPMRDFERQGDASAAGNSPLYKASEQHKKLERLKKLDESKEEARANAERKKKEKEFLMKKEREEIERQKREVEERELKRAAERERRRKEEEQREAREKEERERRRKEREDRERLRKIKEKEEKLRSNEDSRKQRERLRDVKSKKEPRSNFQAEVRNDESSEASILDRLFGDSDSLKSTTRISDREESRRRHDESRSRSSSVQKPTGKVKLSKEEYYMRREKPERGSDSKAAKNTRDGSSSRPDALDDLFNCLASRPSTSRKDEMDVVETRPYKQAVVSGVNKGRQNLLIGGGHSARVGMVLEKATRVRTKHEHDEKMKQEYRKLESVRRASASFSEPNARKRILDLPIPKTPDLLSQILKSDTTSSQNDPLRRSISAKNISNCTEAKDTSSAKSFTTLAAAAASSVEQYEVGGSSGGTGPSSSSTTQIKKPRLDMATIESVLQCLHGTSSTSSSSSPSALPSTSSASVSEQKAA